LAIGIMRAGSRLMFRGTPERRADAAIRLCVCLRQGRRSGQGKATLCDGPIVQPVQKIVPALGDGGFAYYTFAA
jgi:hypothetical protein